jgi:hypothetical protein
MRSLPLPLLLAALVPAQTPLFVFDGRPASRLGHSVASIGDVDGDGVRDLIAGMPHNNVYSGSVRLFCGRTGAILRTVHADSADQQVFGWAICGLGDVDRDGAADFAAGAPTSTHNGIQVGSVAAYSGRTGQRLWLRIGDGLGDLFGNAIANAGDIDGDGRDDVLVGAPENGAINGGPGYARVLSGKDGSTIYTFRGADPADEFGINVGAAGDIDRDGVPDLLVGSSLETRGISGDGSLRLFSGRTGAVMFEWFAEYGSDHFGFGIASPGDLDGDGTPDILGAAPNVIVPAIKGYVQALSGRTGAALYTVRGDADTGGFGMQISGAGDIDGDGTPDFAVGDPGHMRGGAMVGSAQFYSGRTGRHLHTIWGAHDGAALGCSLAALGDRNGDGSTELFIGAFGNESNGAVRGRATVYSMRDAARTQPSCPGSISELRGSPPRIGEPMSLALLSREQRAHGCLLVSALPGRPSPIGDCLLYLDPATATANVAFATDASGTWLFKFIVPNEKSLIDNQIALQTVLVSAGPRGYDASNGVYVTVRQ